MSQESIHALLNHFSSEPLYDLKSALQKNKHLFLKGSLGSHFSLLIAHHFTQYPQNILVALDSKEEAFYLLNELEEIFSKEEVLFFPESYKKPYVAALDTDNANIVLRTEVLSKLLQGKSAKIIVSYSQGLVEKVVQKTTLERDTIRIQLGDQLDTEFLTETLVTYGFIPTDFVTEPGEFALRGGIVDIFSYGQEHPTRLSFFGNEVEKIKAFDLSSQLSVKELTELAVLPNLEDKSLVETRINLLEYLGKDTLVFTKNASLIKAKFKQYFEEAHLRFKDLNSEIKHLSPEELFVTATDFHQTLEGLHWIEMGSQPLAQSPLEITFNLSPQPSFNKQFELLIDNLHQHLKNGYRLAICCSSNKQVQRLQDIFEDLKAHIPFLPLISNLHEGFIDHQLKWVCYTDHQLFDRYQKFHQRNAFAKKEHFSLSEIQSLQIGDYVTHIDHGIGKFSGLKKINNNGHVQETIKLVYRDRDVMYVNIHALHKIAKYSGKDGVEPKLSKLGSPAWKELTKKTKKKVKEMAYDLIQLYAKRKMQKGFAFSPDSYLQKELEASFMYEDTPDQFTTTQEVKKDMESERSMDRLICGDVGFGKTEIAIRAAFKAATDGKQVVILVPTTILAFQHYNTFSERLKDFPVTVEYLNRFKTTKEKTEILKQLESGAIDIIIGTHQLVNPKIKYRDLGLLIVDEEHKFGVSIKEKLKTLKANLDTLTLTATPIPRTLQFSLMAARDLSIIKTAPPNRQPINTEIIGFNEELIRDAVFYELQRGGQVFIINNRIENLKEFAGMVQRLVPEAKIGIGHGQMEGKKLEDLMLTFMRGDLDVLVSTTIIESGLDVPNANTILINQAQNFGLSDLHQMRGRVGRSNKKAFCYLITPPSSLLTSEARSRLQAIEQFSDLGDGIKIAMKDLEIRGAGNLLGAEQSGFMADIGFETYQRILNEAVMELKYNPEFKYLYPAEKEENAYLVDTQIDTDLSIQIPDEYVNSTSERFSLYSELAKLETEEELTQFRTRLIDRFGDYPEEMENLFISLRLKWLAKSLGFEKLLLKHETLLCYFINDPQSPYYQSDLFRTILTQVQSQPKWASFKEKPAKKKGDLPQYFLRFNHIIDLPKAISELQKLIPSSTKT